MKKRDAFMGTLLAFALLMPINARAIEDVNPDFERLKNQLIGSWNFVEDGKIYEATFDAVSHGRALLERNSRFYRRLSPRWRFFAHDSLHKRREPAKISREGI